MAFTRSWRRLMPAGIPKRRGNRHCNRILSECLWKMFLFPDMAGGGEGKFFVDKRILFVIVTPRQNMSGRNSVVECHLAKVDVDGSNPFARSILNLSGGIAKWLRQRSAKPLFPGSSPGAASIHEGGSDLELAPFSVDFGCLPPFIRSVR